MANYGGFNYTNFKGVNFKNTAFIRIQGDGGYCGTMSMRSSIDKDLAWYLPDKSGSIGITGTFSVNLPSVNGITGAGITLYGTNVVLAGVRAEDGMVCTIQNTTTTAITSRGCILLAGVDCGNGGVNVTFCNPTGSATVYKDIVMAYTLVR